MPLRLLVVAALLAVRLVAPNADPPAFLSWSTGPYTDEGFYTLDARHQVLFGHLAPGDFHDRLLSPLLSGLQQAVFTVFGPSLLSARLFSITFSLLTLWLFWLGLRRLWGVPTADWGLLLLGLAPPFVFYNRLALQDTPTVFWLVLAFMLSTYGRRGLFLSGLAFGLAFAFKPLALLALPAFAWGWSKAGRRVPAPPFLGAGAIALLYSLFWYLPHHAELSRMATFYWVHQMQPHSLTSLWLNLRRGLIGGERGVVPYLLALMPVPCLLTLWGRPLSQTPPLGAVAPELGAGGRSSQFFLLWLFGGLAFCLLSSYAPSRYYVLFLPALAALGAGGAVRLPKSWQTAAAFAFLVTSSCWYGWAWTHWAYARQDAARTLVRTLPPGSSIVGEFAPALCLDTPFAAAPVQPGLSNDDHPLARLHATHIAVTRTPLWETWWRTRYPQVLLPSHRVAAFTLGGPRHYVVDVYAVTEGRHPALER